MSDYLKKGFLLGIGAALSGKEKLEQKLKDLVERNEITREQAKNMMDDFISKGENKNQEWSDKQKEQIRNLAEEFGLATKEETQALRQRIIEIEDQLTNKVSNEE